MRNRHLPRVCADCQAPMAGQESRCWRCGVEWASEEEPHTRLRLVSGQSGPDPEPAAAEVAVPVRAAELPR
jgi:predicted amidophosphoribosyltransferase